MTEPTRIRLEVHGIPSPQGSKSAFVRKGRAVMIEGSSASGRTAHAAWRQAVATAARDFLTENPRPPIDEPVELIADFRFPATASDPYRRRHTVKPDLDKLVRSTCDALVSGGLLRDDTLIYRVHTSKVFAVDDEWVGAEICIGAHGGAEALERESRKQLAAVRRQNDRNVARQSLTA
jgi:Holliday junction resolvase RusA-like endonuclease